MSDLFGFGTPDEKKRPKRGLFGFGGPIQEEPEVPTAAETIEPFDPRPTRVAGIKGFEGEKRTDSFVQNAWLDIKEQGEGLIDLAGLLFNPETFTQTVQAIGENFGPAMVQTYTRWADAAKQDVFLDALYEHPIQAIQDLTFPISFLGSLGGTGTLAVLKAAGKGGSKAANGAATIAKWSDRLGIVTDPVVGLPVYAAGAVTRKISKVPAHLRGEPGTSIGDTSKADNAVKTPVEPKTRPDDSFRATLADEEKATEFLTELENGSLLKRELVKKKGTENFYSGNINLKILHSPEDIDSAINKTADFIIQQNDEFVDQRYRGTGGSITWDTEEKLAAKMHLTPAQLKKTKAGTAFNSTKQLATTHLIEEAEADMLFKAHKARDGAIENKASFVESLSNYSGILNAVSGVRAEAGRALNILKKIPKAGELRRKALNEIIDAAGGDKKLSAMAEKMLEAHTIEDAGKIAKGSLGETSWKIFMETWINSLLSGPHTQMVNLGSNSMVSAYANLIEETAATALSKVPLLGSGERSFREILPRVNGMMRGVARAAQAGLDKGFATGKAYGLEKVMPEHAPNLLGILPEKYKTPIPEKFLRDNQYIKSQLGLGEMKAIKSIRQDKLGKAINISGDVVRLPGTFLQGGDTLFKMVNYSAEVEALAIREAVSKGLKGADKVKFIQDMIGNPSSAIHEAAMAVADVNTFTNRLGGNWVQELGNVATGVTRKLPLARIVIPFIRTPTNIADFALRRTPLGATFKDVRSAIKGGGLQRDIALSRMAVGTGLGIAAFNMAEDGIITGGAPSKPAEREFRRNVAKEQEYSYFDKESGRYISYSRIEPLGSILGMAADLHPLLKYMENDELDKAAALLVGSISKNISSKTFLRGVTDLINAYQDPDRFGERWIQNIAGTVVPTFLAQEARIQDPHIRQVNSIAEKVKSRIPGLSRELALLPNLWGEPVKREFADRINPIYMRTKSKDKVTQAMIDLEYFPGMPSKKIAGVELTPEQWKDYVTIAGKSAKRELDMFASTREWDDLLQTARGQAILEKNISAIINAYRSAARYQIIVENPDIERQFLANR